MLAREVQQKRCRRSPAPGADLGEDGVELPAVDLFDLDHDVDLGAGTIVLEWHARGAPDPDAHAAALRLLGRAGFLIDDAQVDPPPGHTGAIWASRISPPTRR